MEVFYSSPWVPPEWIQAHGFTARGLWPGEAASSTPVPAGVCAMARSSMEFFEAHPRDAVVMAGTCDQMRRAADELRQRRHQVFLFNIPATSQSRTAREIYEEEIERLGHFLLGLGGAAPSPTALAEALEQRDRARARLRELHRGGPVFEEFQAMAKFHGNPAAAGSPSKDTPGDRIPVALVGGPLCPIHWPLFQRLEEAGVRLVLNGAENGERSLLPRLPAGNWRADPVSAMVDAYFDQITDVFQRPNTRLYQWLEHELQARAVRGLVVWSRPACDLWRAEAASLREALDIPLLVLEAGENPSELPRQWGRLQAFVEMLA